jgi:hypothetical protein
MAAAGGETFPTGGTGPRTQQPGSTLRRREADAAQPEGTGARPEAGSQAEPGAAAAA